MISNLLGALRRWRATRYYRKLETWAMYEAHERILAPQRKSGMLRMDIGECYKLAKQIQLAETRKRYHIPDFIPKSENKCHPSLRLTTRVELKTDRSPRKLHLPK